MSSALRLAGRRHVRRPFATAAAVASAVGFLAVGAGSVGDPPAARASTPASLIAFATRGESVADTLDIGVARADGSGLKNVTNNDPGGYGPIWTTDGRGLLVSTDDSSTEIREPVGGKRSPLVWVWLYRGLTYREAHWRIGTAGHDRKRLPGGPWSVPSPDGRLVALLGDTRAEGIVLRDAAGRFVRRLPFRLSQSEYYTALPLWAPNGRYLALRVATWSPRSHEYPNHTRTWLIPVDGRQPAHLLARDEHPLAFSPDSRWLLTPESVLSVDGRRRYALRGGILRASLSWRTNVIGVIGGVAWSPDGRRIAYVGEHGGIYVTNAHDGRGRLVARTPKPTDNETLELTWSPSGTTLAFSEKTGLYLVDADHGHSRRLTTACRFCSPSWRPNGREIAFSRNSEVLAVSVAKGSLRTIAGPPLQADSPVWAPDRSRIAFTRGTDNLRNEQTLGVFIVRPDGTGLRRLGRGYRPQWAPDSRRVVYVDPLGSPGPASLAQERAGRIVVAGLDGSSQQVATGTQPAWSPDGTTIAFVRFTFGTRYDFMDNPYATVVGSTLFLVRVDGSGERVLLTSDSVGGPFFRPRWAPNGSAIAVSQRLTETNDWGEDQEYSTLALVGPSSGAERLLPFTGPGEFRWSPDSQKILVPDYWSISAIDVASGFWSIVGGEEPNHDVSFPFGVWSPDGTRIAYTRCVDHSDPDYSECDVWTAASDGSNRLRVTRTVGIEGELAWAP